MMKRKPLSPQMMLVVLAVFIVLETVASLLVWRSYENKKMFILDRNVKIFNDVYRNTRQGYTKIAKLLYDQIINRPDVIAIYKETQNQDPAVQAKARQQLYNKLLPVYKSLEAINIRQLHFHLPDSSSFLRFHRPEKFGDSLVGIRYSLEVANRDKVYVEGFEEGRIFNGFRYVYPVFDEKAGHLGSVEMSLSARALCDDIEKTTGFYVDFVVKKAIVMQKVWEEEQQNYVQSDISGDYLHEREDREHMEKSAQYRDIKRAMAPEATEKMKKNQPFSLYERGCIVSFIPIRNVKGEAGVAYVIGFNETHVITQMKETMTLVWFISTLGVFIIVFLGVMLFQKIVLINEMATRDALTGLYNRHTMSDRIDMEIARHKRSNQPFSLIYLDVDDFKKINDLFGHLSGDKVLKTLARLLKENTRDIDMVARWGGEEFLICLPNTSAENAKNVAEKLRHIIESAPMDVPMKVTCSFGTATYQSGEDHDRTVARADAQLYRAKTAGKNTVCSDMT